MQGLKEKENVNLPRFESLSVVKVNLLTVNYIDTVR